MSQDDLAYLFHVSLDKLAFLPFAYVMDQWRWNLFTGALAEQDINDEWWRLREQLQGTEKIIPSPNVKFLPKFSRF